MGLDNGFILFNKKTEEKKEIVYWRKHYDYRHEVLYSLKNINPTIDDYEFNITPDDIDRIIESLTPYLDEEFWKINSSTIWDFEPKLLKEDIKALKKAKKLLKRKPNNYTLTFYDSY